MLDWHRKACPITLANPIMDLKLRSDSSRLSVSATTQPSQVYFPLPPI